MGLAKFFFFICNATDWNLKLNHWRKHSNTYANWMNKIMRKKKRSKWKAIMLGIRFHITQKKRSYFRNLLMRTLLIESIYCVELPVSLCVFFLHFFGSVSELLLKGDLKMPFIDCIVLFVGGCSFNENYHRNFHHVSTNKIRTDNWLHVNKWFSIYYFYDFEHEKMGKLLWTTCKNSGVHYRNLQIQQSTENVREMKRTRKNR